MGPATSDRNHLTPCRYVSFMSTWEDHQEMIDGQYLMESIKEDKFTIPLDEIAINGKFLDGWTLDDEEDLEDDK